MLWPGKGLHPRHEIAVLCHRWNQLANKLLSMSSSPADIILHTCRKCGSNLPQGRLDGHCPNCLIATSIGSLVDFSSEELGMPTDEVQPWTVLGDCELYAELGRGGMGVVYRARQRTLRRPVAVKILRGGELAGEEAKARFRAEAENAARLKHPGIVAIHEIGETQGVCWFTMDLIEGESLDRIVRDQPMESRAAAQCVAKIADAVQHAHEQGVLHRDLKPPNILLDVEENPHVTDFGIARRIGADSEAGTTPLTRTGQMLGSPGYSAPEQALLGSADVRTDVYGLGAILYHLLTGRPPFQGPTLDAVLVQLRENEPLSPRKLNPSVPHDVETICLKCLSRDPAKRYQSAVALNEDLQRWLDGRPILGRPVSMLGKTWRWMKRRPGIAALLMLVLVGTGAAFFLIEQSRREEAAARMDEGAAKVLAENRSEELRQANQRTRDLLDTTELQRAEEWFRTGERHRGLEALARVLRRTPDHPVASARLGSALLHGGASMPVMWPMMETNEVIDLMLVDQGKKILVCLATGVILREADTGKEIRRFNTTPDYVDHFALSPDQTILCSWHINPAARLFLWNVATGKLITDPIQHAGWLHEAIFTPDGRHLLLIGSDPQAHLLEVATGKESHPALEHSGSLFAGAISANGALAATTMKNSIFLWNLPERRLLTRLAPLQNTANHVAISNDGTLLAASSFDGEIAVYPTTGEPAALWAARHGKMIRSIQFSPGGKRLLTASNDNTSRLWEARTGIQIGSTMIHQDEILRAVFEPDAVNFICSVSNDSTARLWDAHTGRALAQPMQHGERVNASVFSPDKSTLYTAGAAGAVLRWNIRSAACFPIWMEHQDEVVSAAWSADDQLVATTSLDKVTAVWNASTGAKQFTYNHRSPSRLVTFPPTGPGVMVGSDWGGSRLKDLRPELPNLTAYEIPNGGIHTHGAFSADGKFYAAGTLDGRFYVWGTDTQQLLFPPIKPQKPDVSTVSVMFSSDSSRLLTIAANRSDDDPNEAALRSLPNGALVAQLVGHDDEIHAGCFSPDGNLIATASNDNTARLWDGHTGKFNGSIFRHHATVESVAFNPSGALLATASTDRQVRIWDIKTGRLAVPIMQHQEHVLNVSFSPDGSRLATCCRDGMARIWDVKTGLPLTENLPCDGEVKSATFSKNGSRLLALSKNRTARIWEVPSFSTAPNWAINLAELLTFSELENNTPKIMALIARYQQTLEAMSHEPSTSPWAVIAKRLATKNPK